MASVAVVVGALGAAGCAGRDAAETIVHGSEATAAVVATTATAITAEVPSTFEAGGIVRARSTVVIASRVMAPVLRVGVQAGDRVKRGAPLVTLDAREMTANAARGSASLIAAAESERAAESQAAAAEADLVLAQATHDRISGLFERRSATAQELDQAVAARRSAEARLQGARAQIAAAAAARDAARAVAEATVIGISYATLAAPVDGIVAARSVDPGSLATPGTPLLVIEEAGPVRLEVALDESRAAGILVGHPVEVRLDAAGADWIRSAVSEVGRIDPAAHSVLVKIDLPAATSARTGAFGRARFAGATRQALTVPPASIVRRGQLAFVFIVDRERRARLRPITPGQTIGDRTEVLAGISDGETVLAAPTPALTDGTLVAPSDRRRATPETGGAR
jgi:RND family efflux transporter MFP subunit